MPFLSAGAHAARVARVDDTHLILILDFRTAEDADRVPREAGGRWMRENVVPLLADDTERTVGEVIPVVAVLRLDPAALTRQVTPRSSLRDDALEFVLADDGPEELAVVEKPVVRRSSRC